MKKTKLLTSLVGLTSLSLGLMPMITSCNKGEVTPTPTPIPARQKMWNKAWKELLNAKSYNVINWLGETGEGPTRLTKNLSIDFETDNSGNQLEKFIATPGGGTVLYTDYYKWFQESNRRVTLNAKGEILESYFCSNDQAPINTLKTVWQSYKDYKPYSQWQYNEDSGSFYIYEEQEFTISQIQVLIDSGHIIAIVSGVEQKSTGIGRITFYQFSNINSTTISDFPQTAIEPIQTNLEWDSSKTTAKATISTGTGWTGNTKLLFSVTLPETSKIYWNIVLTDASQNEITIQDPDEGKMYTTKGTNFYAYICSTKKLDANTEAKILDSGGSQAKIGNKASFDTSGLTMTAGDTIYFEFSPAQDVAANTNVTITLSLS